MLVEQGALGAAMQFEDNSYCMYLAGRVFYERNDTARATEWLSKAAAHGHDLAHLHLGFLSDPEDAVPHFVEAHLCDEKLLPSVLDELQELAKDGCHTAATVFADLVVTYHKDDMEEIKQAAWFLQKAEESGRTAYTTSAGTLWRMAADGKTNDKEKCRYLQYAYDTGVQDYETRRELAGLYLKGVGSCPPTDSVGKGIKLLEFCAKESIEDALGLADLFIAGKTLSGIEIGKRYTRARKLLARKDLQQNARAAFLRAQLFECEFVDGLSLAKTIEVISLYETAKSLGCSQVVIKLSELGKCKAVLEKCDALLREVDGVECEISDEKMRVDQFVFILEKGLKQDANVVDKRIVQAIDSFKDFEALVIAGGKIFALKNQAAQPLALALMHKAVVRYQAQVLDEKVKNEADKDRTLKDVVVNMDSHKIPQLPTSLVWQELLEKEIIPLVDVIIKQGNSVAYQIKSMWFESQLFAAQDTPSVGRWLAEGDMFWGQLENSNVSNRDKRVFLYHLGQSHIENYKQFKHEDSFLKANSYLKKAYTEYHCYKSGELYALCLINQMRAQGPGEANKTWKEIQAIWKLCAEPSKGNSVGIQSLLAKSYFWGEKKTCLGKHLLCDIKCAEKYARLAIAQGSRSGHAILACCLSPAVDPEFNILLSKANRESKSKVVQLRQGRGEKALEHFLEAFKDESEWDALPAALYMQNQLGKGDPMLAIGLKAVALSAQDLNGGIKTLKLVIENALVDSGKFVDPLVQITIDFYKKKLRESVGVGMQSGAPTMRKIQGAAFKLKLRQAQIKKIDELVQQRLQSSKTISKNKTTASKN